MPSFMQNSSLIQGALPGNNSWVRACGSGSEKRPINMALWQQCLSYRSKLLQDIIPGCSVEVS